MKRALLVLLMSLFLMPSVAHSQSRFPSPGGTFAALPASGVKTKLYTVIDCVDSDCTAGSGSAAWVLKQWSGSAWVNVSQSSGGTWDFVPDPSSATQGLQELITAACDDSDPIVIEFGEGTTTIDYTGFSGTALSDGIIDFPENCNKVTLRGQGKQVSILNFTYDLRDADNDGGDVIDLKVFRLRGNRWIQFKDIQIAARNDCNENYDYDLMEKCISDARIMFSIEAATDSTTSKHINFDNVHLHFPGTYDLGFTDMPNIIRAINSEEVHVRDSLLHGNGLLVLVDDCLACTVNFNWFGSTFSLDEGPHGIWMTGIDFSESNAAQTDADYTREMQAAIVMGVGEGKEVIGNRIDKTQLKFENMQSRTQNATSAIAMTSILDFTGEVPRGAIVTNNSIYNVMDRNMGGIYFINYNGAIVSNNSMTCHDLSDPSNCEGGSIIRIISQAGSDPAEAYNRDNIFSGNVAIKFPTAWPDTNAITTPVDYNSCITIQGATASAIVSYGADTVNADNYFIGNTCDTDNSMFFFGGDDTNPGRQALKQNWGPGNLDLSTGVEYSPGSVWLNGDRTLKTSQICHGGVIQNGLQTTNITVTLPPISPNMGGLGCSWRASNLSTGNTLKICATNNYFAVLNDPTGTSGSRCIISNGFYDWAEVTSIRFPPTAITSITLGATTTIGFNSAGSASIFDPGDRIHIAGILGTNQFNNREFIVKAVFGSGASSTFTLFELDGTTAFDSTGFTAWVTGGNIERYDWIVSPQSQTAGADDWVSSP